LSDLKVGPPKHQTQIQLRQIDRIQDWTRYRISEG
jgi:hypothetical protein